jgi:probable HAF family extracellular repeat protein
MHYELTEINPPRPYSGVVLRSIDNMCRIAGYSYTARDDAIHAVIWSDDRITDLGTLGGRNSFANGINEAGVAVGYSEVHSASLVYHAFRFEAGFLDDLSARSPLRSAATAINAAGLIVGEAQRKSGVLGACYWSDDDLVELEGFGEGRSTAFGVNSAGIICGQAYLTENEAHAVLWIHDEMLDMGTLGGLSSAALGINDAGHVVGWSETSSGACRAFIWIEGEMHPLPGLGGLFASARAINNEGIIVGSSSRRRSAEAVATCWIDGSPYDLRGRVSRNTGCMLRAPKSINRRGDIVGEGTVGGQTKSFYLHRVDEDPVSVEPETETD